MKERTSVVLIVILASVFLILVLVNYLSGTIRVADGLQVSYYRFIYKLTDPEKDFEKLEKLHQNAGSANKTLNQRKSAQCIACHGSMVEKGEAKKTNDKKREAMFPIHEAMLTSPLLEFNCVDCHKRVDMRRLSPAHSTMKVDRKTCSRFPCHNPFIMEQHKAGDAWIINHPRLAAVTGLEQCDECHKEKELDFCSKCHDRGGMRASSHRAQYNVPIKRLFPEIGREDIVSTRWKGFHFVFAREALEKMGAANVSASNLPLDKVEKLPCRFCHVLKEWCTKCHIKHAPNWLDREKGHPARIKESGSNYCFNCHDPLGSKCLACHPNVAVK